MTRFRTRSGPANRGALRAARDDAGFAMLSVVGWSMVMVLTVTLLSAYALSSTKGARRQQDFVGAVSAAQAGASAGLGALQANTLPAAGQWSAWAVVPDSRDAAGQLCTTVRLNCPRYTYTAVTKSNGDVDIYAVGDTYSNGTARANVQRAVRVTAHRALPTDFLYYSEVEAADPKDGLAYPNGAVPAGCGGRAWDDGVNDPRPATGCQVPAWRSGDETHGGRVHSNDAFTINGTPEFDSRVTTAYDQCTSAGAVSCVRGGAAQFPSGSPARATDLQLSADPGALLARASATGPFSTGQTRGCVFTGPTRIKFVDDEMLVWSPQTTDPYTIANCGGGMPASVLQALSGAGVLVNGVLNLVGVNLDSLLRSLGLAPTPHKVPKNNVIYIKDYPQAASLSPLYCTLGALLNLAGTLDVDLLSGGANCGAGRLFVDGDLDGRVTVATEDDVVVMSDLEYSADDSSLGLVSAGSIEVYNPLLCALAVATCLNPGDVVKGLGSIGPDVHELQNALIPPVNIDAALVSLKGHVGMQFPLLPLGSLSVDALNALSVDYQGQAPAVTVNGAIAQMYRGTFGADVTANVALKRLEVNVASANVGLGYRTVLEYDENLRDDPPPYLADVLNPSRTQWRQDSFAEVPVGDLPAGRPAA